MNSIACGSTDAELDCTSSSVEESYATAALPVVLPAYQPPSEEELHSDFEQAISQRVSALNVHLQRLNSRSHDVYCETGPLQPSCVYLQAIHAVTQTRPAYTGAQKIAIFACFAFIFMLLGFNLMGLLVLHIH